jgi:hypothetical protein
MGFARVDGRALVADFQGGAITSNAGGLGERLVLKLLSDASREDTLAHQLGNWVQIASTNPAADSSKANADQ